MRTWVPPPDAGAAAGAGAAPPPPLRAHLLVSELLGSFGDNELSPECLHGAANAGRLLRPGGVCIPAACESWLAPCAAAGLADAVAARAACGGGGPPGAPPPAAGGGGYGAAAWDTPYVVRLHRAALLAPPQRVFRFAHPAPPAGAGGGDPAAAAPGGLAADAEAAAAGADHSRAARLSFDLPPGAPAARVHGLAGFFTATLFGDVVLSTLPGAVRAAFLSRNEEKKRKNERKKAREKQKKSVSLARPHPTKPAGGARRHVLLVSPVPAAAAAAPAGWPRRRRGLAAAAGAAAACCGRVALLRPRPGVVRVGRLRAGPAGGAAQPGRAGQPREHRVRRKGLWELAWDSQESRVSRRAGRRARRLRARATDGRRRRRRVYTRARAARRSSGGAAACLGARVGCCFYCAVNEPPQPPLTTAAHAATAPPARPSQPRTSVPAQRGGPSVMAVGWRGLVGLVFFVFPHRAVKRLGFLEGPATDAEAPRARAGSDGPGPRAGRGRAAAARGVATEGRHSRGRLWPPPPRGGGGALSPADREGRMGGGGGGVGRPRRARAPGEATSHKPPATSRSAAQPASPPASHLGVRAQLTASHACVHSSRRRARGGRRCNVRREDCATRPATGGDRSDGRGVKRRRCVKGGGAATTMGAGGGRAPLLLLLLISRPRCRTLP